MIIYAGCEQGDRTGDFCVRAFLVFACPKCRNFTNAPVGQKRRRCSYCGHIIDIRRAQCAFFDTPEAAQRAVKEFNAARGGDEFQRAVERSRERIRSLVPRERISSETLVDTDQPTPQTGKRKTLLTLLETATAKGPCSLDEFADLCEKYRLDWVWVEEQLTKLANQGVVIFPRPWSIQLIQEQKIRTTKRGAVSDITGEIREYLAHHGGNTRVTALVEYFGERGIDEVVVEKALNKMMRKGEIYEPKPGEIKLVS